MGKPRKTKPKAEKPAAKHKAEKLTPMQFTSIMLINMREAMKLFEGTELIQVMAVVYEEARRLAEAEAGIESDLRPTKAVGILMAGIQKLANETNRSQDEITIELLDKLGAPHGLPFAAWN